MYKRGGREDLRDGWIDIFQNCRYFYVKTNDLYSDCYIDNCLLNYNGER